MHADNPALAVLAGFDLVVNNADRKGSHVLPTADGRILGVDHGLCFHTDDKLRTILWGWAGHPLPDAVIDGIARLRSALDGDLGERLDELITTAEMARAAAPARPALAATKKFPGPRLIARRSRGRRYERVASDSQVSPSGRGAEPD